MMMVMQTEEKYTESKYSLRDIYECAEEWTHKYKTSNGVVDYFKAYFSNGSQKISKEINQVS